jgi:putative cell wall-binding protein
VSNGTGTISVVPTTGIEYGVIVYDVSGYPMPSNRVDFRAANMPPVTRIGGESRYDVAVGISEEYFPAGASVVYIATGTNFPDALSAAPAAALRGAPLLLVDTNVIPQSVRDELERLNPDTIVIAGGPASVSEAVKTELGAYASTVVRHSGENRYEVSNKITRDAFEGSGATVAYIATGATFPDALSASAAAGTLNAPVILVYGLATSLDPQTADLLQEASGLNFPDALSGAAVAGAVGAPLYVIPPGCVPGYVIDDIANFGADEVRIFGGPASVTPAAAAMTRCP